jgi:hypothetical protein
MRLLTMRPGTSTTWTATIGLAIAAATALGLVALLSVFAFTTAFHSVHHLADSHADRSCPIAGASTHVSGATTALGNVGVPVTTSGRGVDPSAPWLVPLQPIRAREGRAPPVPVPA